jgi:hypothetical protein
VSGRAPGCSSHLRALVILYGWAIPLALGHSAASTSPTVTEGTRRSIEVQLRHLPKRYSCAELSTITREVLQALGVNAVVRVTARRCERALGFSARSPAMTVILLPGAQEPPASTSGRRVRVAAGTPPVLKDQDCELLRQLYLRLLSRLTLDIAE